MRILMVTSQLLHAPISGARQRTQLIFRTLQRSGNVDLFLLGDVQRLPQEHQVALEQEFNLVGSAPALKRGEFGLWRLIRPLWPAVVDRIANNVGRCSVGYRRDPYLAQKISEVVRMRKYDIIVGRYLLPTVQSGAFDLGLPVIVDVDDLDTQVCQNRLSSAGVALWERPLLINRLRQLNRIVPVWLSRASHLWLSCSLDVQLVAHRSVTVLPNVPFSFRDSRIIAKNLCRQDANTVLVVGLLSWPPNSRGVQWFLRNVWPLILDSGIEAKLRIVGAGPPERLASRWRAIKGVSVVGFADDIGSEYQRASVVIAPIFEGGGTKIKVIEALQNRCATVVTSQALRGYSHLFTHGDSVLIADSPNLFADSVICLLKDEGLRSRLGLTGARIVSEHLSTDTFARVVHRTIAEIGNTADRHTSLAART